MLTGWSGHAVTIWINEDILYRCNGGGFSTDSSVEVYKIGDTKALTLEVIIKILKQKFTEVNQDYMQRDLHSI